MAQVGRAMMLEMLGTAGVGLEEPHLEKVVAFLAYNEVSDPEELKGVRLGGMMETPQTKRNVPQKALLRRTLERHAQSAHSTRH